MAPRYFQSKALISLIVLALIFFLITFPFFLRLNLEDIENERILSSYTLEDNNQFMIGFIHSTNLTPVEEYFVVDANLNLVLIETHFESYSVGMPSELNVGEVLEVLDGKIIIKNMNRSFSQIDLRIGQVIANHTLYINDSEIRLSEVATSGSVIRFKAKKLSIYELLSGRL